MRWSWSDFSKGMWPELFYAFATWFVIGWLIEEIRKRDAAAARFEALTAAEVEKAYESGKVMGLARR